MVLTVCTCYTLLRSSDRWIGLSRLGILPNSLAVVFSSQEAIYSVLWLSACDQNGDPIGFDVAPFSCIVEDEFEANV